MVLHDRNEKSTVNNGASMLNDETVRDGRFVIWTYLYQMFPDAGLFAIPVRRL